MTVTTTLLVLLAMMTSHVMSVTRVDVNHHRIRRSLRSGSDPSPAKLLGLAPDEQLKVTSYFTTPQGHTKVKMAETYKGLPVLGETIVLELDSRGGFTGEVQGRLVRGLDDDLPCTLPQFSPQEALNTALSKTRDDPASIRFDPDKNARLVVYVVGFGTGIKAELAYQLSYRVETNQRVSRPEFIINARTGKLIKQWDSMNFASIRRYGRMWGGETEPRRPTMKRVRGVGGNEKVGQIMYGYDLPKLQVNAWPNGTCLLQNDDAVVFNCNGSFNCDTSNMTPHHFDCEMADVAKPVNGAYSPMNDAFFHIGITAKMLREWYNMSDPLRTGEDRQRWQALVRYGNQWENAAWDGERLLIGDGAEVFHPLTSLNMVAHEMAHGVTSAHSELMYDGQSGAISEAFSDMTGEAAEDFLLGSVDWGVSYSDIKAPNKSVRYFRDPSMDGFSISHYRDYCLGVDSHSSSGLFNKAFYNLATTQGWTVRRAFHTFLLANVLYWHPESQFADASCDVISAAKDLDLNSKDVTKAFMDVGIVPCSTEKTKILPGPLNMEANSTMQFKINPYNIKVKELVIATDQVHDLEMAVETGGQVFDVRAPHGTIPDIFTIPTKGECKERAPCYVTLTSFEDIRVTVLVLTPVVTLLQEADVDTQTPKYYKFRIPETVVSSKARIMFRAQVEDENGGVRFYIKHGVKPKGLSHEFDASGTMDTPAFLCRPVKGDYYLEIQGFHYGGSETVSKTTLTMYAMLGAEADCE